MPIASDMENLGLIYGGKELASTVRLVQTKKMELVVLAGALRLPEFGERAFALEEDVVVDFSTYPDPVYPVSVTIDLVEHDGKVKVLVDRVVKDGPPSHQWEGGRQYGSRFHLGFSWRGDRYRYEGRDRQALAEHADKRKLVRLVREGWFIFPPGATALPPISYLKVVHDQELVRRNRDARATARNRGR